MTKKDGSVNFMFTKPRIVLVFAVVLMSATLYYLFKPHSYAAVVVDPIQVTESTIAEEIDWKAFSSENPTFQVLLPSTPQHAQESVQLPASPGVMKYDLYLSQAKSGTTFMISVIGYPDGYNMASADSLLEGVQKEMLTASDKNKLLESNKGTFLTQPSLDFIIESPDVTTKTRAFIENRNLYVLTVVDRVKSSVDKDFDHFISSFQTTPAPTALPIK